MSPDHINKMGDMNIYEPLDDVMMNPYDHHQNNQSPNDRRSINLFNDEMMDNASVLGQLSPTNQPRHVIEPIDESLDRVIQDPLRQDNLLINPAATGHNQQHHNQLQGPNAMDQPGEF